MSSILRAHDRVALTRFSPVKATRSCDELIEGAVGPINRHRAKIREPVDLMPMMSVIAFMAIKVPVMIVPGIIPPVVRTICRVNRHIGPGISHIDTDVDTCVGIGARKQ